MLVGTPYEGGQNWPEITMHMRGDEENYNADLMANDIVAQLQENLGMNVNIQVLARGVLAAGALQKPVSQLVWIRWWYDYRIRTTATATCSSVRSRPESGRRGPTGSDDLVIQAKGEADPDKRLEIYKKAERVIQEESVHPVVYRVDQYAFKPWVKDVAVNRQGFTVPEGNIYARRCRTCGSKADPRNKQRAD